MHITFVKLTFLRFVYGRKIIIRLSLTWCGSITVTRCLLFAARRLAHCYVGHGLAFTRSCFNNAFSRLFLGDKHALALGVAVQYCIAACEDGECC